MKLDITHMIRDLGLMCTLSGSCAELGDKASQITWNNSLKYAKKYPLLKPPQFEEAKRYFKDFGAWSNEEIKAWPVETLQALTVQEIASQLRGRERYENNEEWLQAQATGTCSGCIYQGPDSKWYAYIGL